MKYLKAGTLFVGAMVVVMGLAANASATVATAPVGTVYTGMLKGKNSGSVSFHSSGITITCTQGEIEGEIEQHGAGITGKGKSTSFTYSGCNHHVTPLVKGTIEVHATGGGNGTITSSGTSATVLYTTIFGNIHCIFETQNTDLGTVTGATSSTGHATVHLSGSIPAVPTNPLCGSAVVITGAGIITSPTGLTID